MNEIKTCVKYKRKNLKINPVRLRTPLTIAHRIVENELSTVSVMFFFSHSLDKFYEFFNDMHSILVSSSGMSIVYINLIIIYENRNANSILSPYLR